MQHIFKSHSQNLNQVTISVLLRDDVVVCELQNENAGSARVLPAKPFQFIFFLVITFYRYIGSNNLPYLNCSYYYT